MLIKVLYPFIIVFVFSACSTFKPQNNNLIKPWSKELAKSQPFKPPFVATYNFEGKTLTFIGIAHENMLSSKSFETMRRAFDKRIFEFVIAEGFPFAYGVNHTGMKQNALADGKNGFFKGEESNYAIVLADKYNLPFVGGEPERLGIADNMNSKGFSREDFFYLCFLQMIAQKKRGEGISAKDLPSLFDEFYSKEGQKFGSMKPVSLLEFKNWYQNKNKIDFNIDSINSNTAAPAEDGHLYTQHLSSIVGQIRDEHIFHVIENALTKYNHVVIIYGAGHWSKQKLALENLMGRPKLEKLVP